MATQRVPAGVPAPAVALADLDAVTLDAYGTLLRLRDPVGHLDRELRARGVELDRDAVERGFRAEVDFYVAEHLSARDEATLAALRERCAAVFLEQAGASLAPSAFAAALEYEYELLPGAAAAVDELAGHGLALAVVANWDFGLHEQLRRHGLAHRFGAVVTAAEIGAAKPDAAPFRAALERLGVAPSRALHVGDSDADRGGAAAAGLHFASAPLAAAVAALA